MSTPDGTYDNPFPWSDYNPEGTKVSTPTYYLRGLEIWELRPPGTPPNTPLLLPIGHTAEIINYLEIWLRAHGLNL